MLHALGGKVNPPPLLEIKEYPGIEGVLGKNRFEIQKGKTAFVDGPSGSGKTRLFRRIVDLDPEPIGKILFEGKRVQTYPLPELRRKILFVPQDPPRLQGIAKEVLETLIQGSGEKNLIDQREELLRRFELLGTLERHSTQLSGGEWKRLILIAALSKSPTILLLDEPFAGLDKKRIDVVASTIHSRTAHGLTVLWTSHQEVGGPLQPDQTLQVLNRKPL